MIVASSGTMGWCLGCQSNEPLKTEWREDCVIEESHCLECHFDTCSRGMFPWRGTIHYAGKKMKLQHIFGNTNEDLNEAQALINAEKSKGREACCTHSGRKTYFYVEMDS